MGEFDLKEILQINGTDDAQAWEGWGGGRVFTHSGSNNQNFAVVWMAPLKNFAVLAATNQGGDTAATAWH